MKDIHLLTELAHVKILADPLRQRVLRALVDEEKTATQLVGEIEEAPSNLHYHVEQLRGAGLVELVRESPKRGTTEKYYRAVAKRFEIAPGLLKLAATDAEVEHETLSLVSAATQSAVVEFAHSLSAGRIDPERDRLAPHVTLSSVRATEEQVRRLRRSLAEWLEECDAASEECDRADAADGAVEYRILCLFFPISGAGDGGKAQPIG